MARRANVNVDISDMIREAREDKKMKPRELAKKVGISRTNMYLIEKRGTTTIKRLNQIAKALGKQLYIELI